VSDALIVRARLAAPLAGDAPHLDALLEWAMSLHHPRAEPGYKVDRRLAAPPAGAIPIPLARRDVAGWPIPLCSSPIVGVNDAEAVEHYAKRIDPDRAGLLAPDARTVMATTNTWTKSYRLPLRVRLVSEVAWFAVGNRKSILGLLRRDVHAIGKKVSIGYGRVREWIVDRVDADLSWFAPTEYGTLLMRPLPAEMELPGDLIGHRPDFGACCPPYWHPDRYGEIVTPC